MFDKLCVAYLWKIQYVLYRTLKNYSMEQSKFGTFMIDDLYLYRASDDYKQVIEEKIVLPEYDKINQLKLLLSRTEYPISAKILIENGFSELTEELKENTGLKSCIIHHKLKGDQKVSIVELEKRISYFLCQSFLVNLYKEYTSLKSRELEELPHIGVMSWQPFMLLRSASLCLFRITLCIQRYDFVLYKTKVS